jgi:GNAT superfamily N-acetyltransferase
MGISPLSRPRQPRAENSPRLKKSSEGSIAEPLKIETQYFIIDGNQMKINACTNPPPRIQSHETREQPLDIRQATGEDVPLILSLIKELADYEKLSHEVTATENSLRESLFGPRPYAEVLLAFLEGEPVGYAIFFHNYSTFLGRQGMYVEDLYVRPLLRARGIGKAMLQRVAQLALERGCGRLEWSVLDWNQPAIDFYKTIGAAPMDDWTIYRLVGKGLDSFSRGLLSISEPHSVKGAASKSGSSEVTCLHVEYSRSASSSHD